MRLQTSFLYATILGILGIFTRVAVSARLLSTKHGAPRKLQSKKDAKTRGYGDQTETLAKLMKLEMLNQAVSVKAPKLETGILALSDFTTGAVWANQFYYKWVAFEHPLVDPVIVVGPPAYESNDEVIVKSVTNHGFFMKTSGCCFEPYTAIQYTAISKGVYYVGHNKLKLVVGKKKMNGLSKVSYKESFSKKPSVVALRQDGDVSSDSYIRINKITHSYFEAAVQDSASVEVQDFDIILGYVALEQGSTTIPYGVGGAIYKFKAGVSEEELETDETYHVDYADEGYQSKPTVVTSISFSQKYTHTLVSYKPSINEPSEKDALKVSVSPVDCKKSQPLITDDKHFITFIAIGIVNFIKA